MPCGSVGARFGTMDASWSRCCWRWPHWYYLGCSLETWFQACTIETLHVLLFQPICSQGKNLDEFTLMSFCWLEFSGLNSNEQIICWKFHTFSSSRFTHAQEWVFLKLAGSIAHHWRASRTAGHHHHMCQPICQTLKT